MSEQLEIQKLVAWLEGHPGEPPPAELDGDIVEAVYVLRPDLAPAPRVRIEDIMGRIQSGPLTEAPIETSPDFVEPTALPEEDLPSFATEDVPTEIAMGRELEAQAANSNPENLSFLHRNRRSIWTGAATISVAALVLFVVLPMDIEQSATSMSMPVMEAPPESVAETELSVFKESLKMEIPEEAAEFEPDSRPDARVPAQKAPLRALAREATEPQAALLDQLLEEDAFENSLSEPSIGSADSMGFGSKGSAEGDAYTGSGMGSYGAGSGGGSISSNSSSDGVAYRGRTEIDFEGIDVEGELAALPPAAAAMEAPQAESPSEIADISSARSARRDRRSERGMYAKEASEDVGVQSDEAPAAPNPSDLNSAKRMSSVSDYNSQWYKADLSVSEAEVIDQAIQSGNIENLTALMSHEDYRVGQDMAFRAATLTYRSGRASNALALIQQGKARSSANTAFLSVLYNLEGEIHQALGDLAAAEQAFRSSAGLNQARTR
ncbi:MAG: hypothetical protein VX519_02090 [Myxococcota bacterium]|nr:hypothetical protein [Myxococcota bacterium]